MPIKPPNVGTKIKATINEPAKVTTRVMGRNFMNSPTTPGQKINGMKAAKVVAVDATIGQAMRWAARV